METHSHKNRNQSDATAAAGETLVGQAGHILVIDDDRGIRETLSDVLQLRDYTVETAGNGKEGLKKLSTRPFDVAIVDIKLPDISGSNLLRLIKEASPEIEVILITAFASLNSAIQAISADAFAYITKPFEMDHLLLTLEKALEKRRLVMENRRLYQVTMQELAERKRVERDLRLQGSVLEAAANAIVITDREGCIIQVNPAFTRLTGYSSEEALGQTPRLLKSGKQDRSFYQNLWETILSGEVWHGELVNRRKDGSLYEDEQTITPVRDEQGQIRHFIAIKQDITNCKQAEEAIQRHRQRLAILHDINLAITSTLDPQAVLCNLLEKIHLLLPYPATTVRLLNRETGEIEPIACRNLDEKEWKAEKWRAGRGTPNLVFETKAPVEIRNVQSDPRVWDPEFYRKQGLISYLGVPLIVKEEILGVLSFYTKEEHQFSKEEVDFLSTLAGQAAIAIKNAHLSQETETQTRRLLGLSNVTRLITSFLDRQRVMDLIVKTVVDLLQVDMVRLWVVDKEGQALHLLAGHGHENLAPMQVTRFSKGQGVVGTIWATDEITFIADITKEPRWLNTDFVKRTGFRSFVGLPLTAEGQVVGVISALSRRLRSFTPEERQLITLFADQAAIAIHNSHLYEQVERRARELSALQTVTAAASESLDLDAVLQEVIKKITEIFHFDATRIFLLTAQGGEIELRAAFETKPEIMGLHEIKVLKLGEGVAGRVTQTGEALIFENIKANLPRYLDAYLKYARRTSFNFLAMFPIKTKKRTAGCIACLGENPRRLTPGEIRLITSMADQVGVAVENATLFEEAQAKAKELSALHSVATVVNQSLDLNLLLRSLMEKVLEIFNFDAARIYLFDEETKELRLLDHQGFPQDAIPPDSYKPGQGILGKVFERGEPIHFKDIQTDPEFHRMVNKGVVLRAGFRGSFNVPIRAKDKMLGVINFISKSVHQFSSNEVQLIHSISNHIGVAIVNAQLYEKTKNQALQLENEIIERKRAEEERARLLAETERNLEHLFALHSVTAAASESLHLDIVLQEVIKKITEVFHFDCTRIFLFNPQMDDLHLQASYEAHPESFGEVRPFRLGQGIVGRVAETGKPMILEDALNDPRYEEQSHSKLNKKGGYSFFAEFPVKVKKRPVGVLVCIGKESRHLATDEIRLITSMTDQIAVAVENATLFQETVNRTRELTTLYSVATAVNKSLDLDSILGNVMYDILEIFHFGAARIYLFDEDRKELCLKAHLGFPRDFNPPSRYKLRQGFIGKVFETGELLLIDDIQNSPEFHKQASRKFLLEAGFHGHFSIPIGAKGRTIGVMNFVSKEPHHFSPGENQLILSIANHVGIAVENARLYEQTKEQASQLEKDINERKRGEKQLRQANAELARHEKALRETIEDLKEAQSQLIQAEKLESVGTLAAGVAHEVKNPLAIILQGIHYMSKHLPTNGDNVAMALQDMGDAVKRADSVVRGLLDFSAPSELSLNTEELNSVVEQSLSLVRHELARYHVNAVSELSGHLPSVRLDRNKMEQVFVNIFLNAIHAMPQGGTLTIKTYTKRLTEVAHNVASRKADDFRVGQTVIMAEVEDTGTGISKEQLSEVFDPFFTTKSTGKGTGLGLTVTKKIIDLHGGTINIGNRKEGGVRASIMFKVQGGNDHEQETDPAH